MEEMGHPPASGVGEIWVALEVAAQSFAAGAPYFALHAGVTLAMLFGGSGVYMLLTPHKEMRLIRGGNPAAALSLGGVLVGLAIPLSVCMATSLNWADIVIWGAATVIVQLIVFRVVDILVPGLARRIADADMAAATFLAATKIAAAFVLAAAVAGLPLARA